MKKLYCTLLCLLVVTFVIAQSKRPPKLPKFNRNKEKNVFLKKQWFLGFKAGVNWSGADPLKTYSAVSPTNYEPADVKKEYINFKDLGTQATIEATFYFSGLSLSFQPTYRRNVFGYRNEYEWTDPLVPSNRLELKYTQQQNLDYFDLPILARYEIMFNKFSPYIQGGLYTSFLVTASKSVQISGTDYASGGNNEFKDETIIVGASDLFANNHWGVLGGLGVYYSPGNVRFNLDVAYRYSLSNITSTQNRYDSDRLSGVGDVMDDMRLRAISVTAGCLFPLRFITKNYRSIENKK